LEWSMELSRIHPYQVVAKSNYNNLHTLYIT
jgi:hypothetical protein